MKFVYIFVKYRARTRCYYNYCFMKKITLGIFFLIFSSISFGQNGWTVLSKGNTLKNWKQKGGAAEYSIDKGIITGVTKKDNPNSFLCTTEQYTDFILEYEIFVDPAINTGVQIRSNAKTVNNKERVYGYQVEVDPSDRAFSGGIYDESRRGWIYPLSLNTKGRSAFKNGVWNAFRVQAIGNSITTWINGVQCANLVDDMTAKGFIALQVHSIPPELDGRLIKWRNIKIKTTNLKNELWPTDPEVEEQSYLVNQLTSLEKRQGWRLLWDGHTNNGWRGAKLDKFPEKGWEIKEGVLTVLATDGGESTGPGDIITTKKYSEFDLELEFKITKGANSGIKYFVDPTLNKGAGSAIGCEFQILDDHHHPDAKKGVKGKRTIGSLYDLITAKNLSIPGRGKQFKGIGKWNKARIIVKGGKVEHWLNNEKVVEYDRFSQMFKALVAYSKYQKWSNFGQWPEGYILLQDHGNTVHYRSIKIREF